MIIQKLNYHFNDYKLDYISYSSRGSKKLLPDFDSLEYSVSGIIKNKNNISNSKLFKYFKADDFTHLYEKIESQSTIHNHHFGITEDAYRSIQKSNQNLIVTSVAKDRKGNEFINSMESKDFNQHKFLAMQFHPELASLIDNKTFMNLKNANNMQVGYKILLAFRDLVEENIKNVKNPIEAKEDEQKYAVIDFQSLKLPSGENKYDFINPFNKNGNKKLKLNEKNLNINLKLGLLNKNQIKNIKNIKNINNINNNNIKLQSNLINGNILKILK